MKERNNRVALVTGGTGGIGSAICKELHDNGFTVVANYRNFTDAMKWREEARAWQEDQLKVGIDVHIVEGDISNFDSAKRMMEEIKEKVGSVDVLVNNAGITRDTQLKRMTPEQWYEVINTKFK